MVFNRGDTFFEKLQKYILFNFSKSGATLPQGSAWNILLKLFRPSNVFEIYEKLPQSHLSTIILFISNLISLRLTKNSKQPPLIVSSNSYQFEINLREEVFLYNILQTFMALYLQNDVINIFSSWTCWFWNPWNWKVFKEKRQNILIC